MLEFLENYYVMVLLLMVLSYLVPKEEYKKYIQLFISIFMVVLFLKPVLSVFSSDSLEMVYEIFGPFNEKVENLEYDAEKGANIFEYFFLEGEGE